VAFAPTALARPKLPATKYENTLLVVGELFDAYLLKSGIFIVELDSLERPNGLSNDDFGASVTLRFWQAAMMVLVAGSRCREQARSNELEAPAK
jgi:hypothetical protein